MKRKRVHKAVVEQGEHGLFMAHCLVTHKSTGQFWSANPQLDKCGPYSWAGDRAIKYLSDCAEVICQARHVHV
jgi:hypothetical protein